MNKLRPSEYRSDLGTEDLRTHIMLAIPHMGQICTNLVYNIILMMSDPSYKVLYQPLRFRNRLDVARNEITELFLQSQCEYLLMINGDMSDDPDHLTQPRFLQMATYGKDIVGALGLMWKDQDVLPTLFYYDEKAEGFKVMKQIVVGDLVECDATGSGVVMIHRRVLEKIEPPYFKDVLGKSGKLELGQDFYFCEKARKAGFRIFVHTAIMTSHFQSIDLLDVFKKKIGITAKDDESRVTGNIRRIK